MRKKLAFILLAALLTGLSASAQSRKEAMIKDILDYLEVKKSKELNTGLRANYSNLISKLPALLDKLPEKDVRFYDCVRESLGHSLHIPLLEYMKKNPNFRDDISGSSNGNCSIGRMNQVFTGEGMNPPEKFLRKACGCK